MRTIYTIARAELKTLVYSPIAWITVVAFFVVSGIQFVNPLIRLAAFQELKVLNEPNWKGFVEEAPLTLNLFLGAIYKFLEYFYLFLPLITMGAINREVNSGNIKLFYSSPLSTVEFVLGKYLGLLFFNSLLLIAIALLLGTGYFSIEHAEWKWGLSMFLSFVLLSAAYLAIGLYISSITNYQIVAALGTFMVFYLFSDFIGGMFADRDVLRDIFYSMAMSGKAHNMIGGLITSRDILYFLAIIILFIGLTIIRIRSFIESQKRIIRLRNVFVLIAVVVSIGYFSSRPGFIAYWDVTRDNRNTLDSATQSVLKELDGSTLQVTLFTNLLGVNAPYGAHVARNAYVHGYWEKVIRFYPNIKLEYEYYYDLKAGDSSFYKTFPKKNIHQIAGQMATVYSVDVNRYQKPDEIDSLVNLSEEDLSLIMELKYRGKRSFLRTFRAGRKGIWPEEPLLSGSIRRLVRDTVPKLLFTSGHYERSPYKYGEREYGMHTTAKFHALSLINFGVDTDTVNIEAKDIPGNTSVLVVADPKKDFQLSEQDKVIKYLKEGGNAIFYAEPGKQDKLNPILQAIGVKVEDGILVRPAKNIMSEHFHLAGMPIANWMAKEEYMQLYQRIGIDSVSAYFFSTATLTYMDTGDFRIEPIVKNFDFDRPTWIENGVFVSDSTAPVFSAIEGDQMKDEYIIGLRLTRKMEDKEQRIIVMGDADFMSSKYYDGYKIGNGFYSWLLYNDYPVYSKVIIPIDRYLTISKKTGEIIYNIFVYVIPGLLLITGGVMLVRRKRQ